MSPLIELSAISRREPFKTGDIERNPSNYFESNPDLIKAAFESENGVVARFQGRVVAYAFFYPINLERNPDARSINKPVRICIHQHLWVHPAWRCLGLGRYILEFAVLVSIAKSDNPLPAIVTTAKFGNEPARAAQAKAGFDHFDLEYERGSDRHLAAASHVLSATCVGEFSLSAYDIRRTLLTADWVTVAHRRGIDFGKFLLKVVDKTDGRNGVMPVIERFAAREVSEVTRLNIADNEEESTVFHTWMPGPTAPSAA